MYYHQYYFINSIWRTISSIIFIIIGILSLAGCAVESVPTYIKNGKEYGKIEEAFRSKWWNYYERGLSFAEGEFYPEAITDLKKAIEKREADQRMARTYGMHFVDYFPHREAGIIYYQTGNLEEAKQELELSLAQFPSAKARFYLDRVRKKLIEQEGKAVAPPTLRLDFETDEVWTRDDPVIISGVASDENYVSYVFIKDKPLFSEGSQQEFIFKESFSLSQGKHEIEVIAQNLLGKKATQSIILQVDREGPVITIENIELNQDNSDRSIKISGSVYDEAGVSELSINNKTIGIQNQREFFFTEQIPPEKDTLALVAMDRLGNRTSAEIGRKENTGVSYHPRAKSQELTANSQQPTANSQRLLASSSDITTLLTASLFGPKDKTPPAIELKEWSETQTVFLEKIYLEGKISDESNIVKLAVNQTPVLRREGKYVFFGHFANLNEGKNEILIEAEDEAGNKAEKKISVIRKIPKALQLKERLSITVLPFAQSNEVSEFSSSFQDNLINALVNQNRFRVVERDRLDMILQEQKLSQTKLIEKETALKLGRLIAARSVITGNIVETRTGIEIVARLTDTETSEILSTVDVYDEANNASVPNILILQNLSEGMAIKFHRDFPLLDGLIIQQKGNYIFTDLGADTVKLQRRLIVYREEPIQHPITGKVLGADNMIIGYARITQVMPDLSKAELLDGESGEIRRLDKVITE